MARNTSDILNGIKLRMLLPNSELTFSDAEILDLASAEVISYIAPYIQKVRQSYFTASTIVPKDGKTRFRIPYRSIGGAIKEVKEIQSGDLTNRRNLPLYGIGELDGNTDYYSRGIYLDGAHINLVGQDSGDSFDSLEISIYIRPSALTSVVNAAQITNISGSVISLNQLPNTYNVGTKVDLIKNGGLNDIVSFDQIIQGNSTGDLTITLSMAPDVDMEIGDWVALAGYSPVANIPEDFYPLLEQRTVVKILEGLGDIQKAGLAQQKATELEKYLIATIVPRIEAEEPVIDNNIFDGWNC